MTGLAFIKINGVDKIGDIQTLSISSNLQTSTATIIVSTRLGVALGWNAGQSVYVETTDGENLFYGKISQITRDIQSNASYKWSVVCKDIRFDYMSIPVKHRFNNTTTADVALTMLINNYTSDAIDTSNIQTNVLCPLSFNGDKLPEAIQAILSLLDIPTHWEIDYDSGTGGLTHKFVLTYTSNLGTLDYADLETGDYTVKPSEIFNQVTVYSSNVIWANPDRQFYDYRQELALWQEKSNRLKLPLKRPAKGLLVYLLVGNDTSSLEDFIGASKIPWTNVKPVDDVDGGLIGFDQKYSGNYVIPDYSLSSTGRVVSTIYGAGESLAFTGEVKQRMDELLKPDSAIYLQSAPKENAPYGYLYIPTLSWLKSKISIVESYAGTVIPTDKILGWCIQSAIEEPKYVEKNNTTSQATYGVLPAPTEELKTKSIAILNLYAQQRLNFLSEEREAGSVVVELWKGSTQHATFYPKPGYLFDLNHPIRGDKTDLKANQVTLDWSAMADSMTCTIDSSKRGKYDLAELLARKIKQLAENTGKPQDLEIRNVHEISNALTISCSHTNTSNTTVGFDGMLRRIYYE